MTWGRGHFCLVQSCEYVYGIRTTARKAKEKKKLKIDFIYINYLLSHGAFHLRTIIIFQEIKICRQHWYCSFLRPRPPTSSAAFTVRSMQREDAGAAAQTANAIKTLPVARIMRRAACPFARGRREEQHPEGAGWHMAE